MRRRRRPCVLDKIPRAEAAARAKETPAKQTPFKVTEGVMVISLGEVDARPGFYDPLHVYPIGYKTEWTNSDSTAKFISEVADKGDGKNVADKPVFRVTRVMLPPPPPPAAAEGAPDAAFAALAAAAAASAVPPPATATTATNSAAAAAAAAAAAPPLVVEGDTPVAAWCKMVVESNSRDSPPPSSSSAPTGSPAGAAAAAAAAPAPAAARVVASAGSADRFCLDDLDVVKSLESNPWVDEMCPGYQFCEQRGTWAEEGLRRAKSVLSAARVILRSMQGAAKARSRLVHSLRPFTSTRGQIRPHLNPPPPPPPPPSSYQLDAVSKAPLAAAVFVLNLRKAYV